MDAAQVKRSVQEFREKTAYGGSTEHCFTPWYLHHHHEIPVTQAVAQSSDGNYDFGLDGFHLLDEEARPKLLLIQSKLSGSRALLEAAYEDLARSLLEVRKIVDGSATDATDQNHVLVNLRSRLNRLPPERKKRLSLELQVVHLSETEPGTLRDKLHAAHTRLKEAFEDLFDGFSYRIRLIGPVEFDDTPVVVPSEMNHIRFAGAVQSFAAGQGARVFTGIGRLSDLVTLFTVRRDHLFSKNVRFFLRSKKNTEKGPAGKMRDTLKQMCVEKKLEPERFALFHNGITIHASRIETTADGLSIREPYVLNGCQTIKNAYFFLTDPHLRKKIDEGCWSRVAVPIRIVETKDDELVRVITVNNNRQNQMSVAALRANDPIQLKLQERFRERKIFYQRQEGALAALETDNPELLDSQYENTGGTCVEIQELARCIAAASGDIYHAEHANDLFESDAAYKRIFSDKKLRSIALLTFLQNVYRVLPVVLRMDMGLDPIGKGPRVGRLRFYALCLVARALARNADRKAIEHYGRLVVEKNNALREFLSKLLRAKKTMIRSSFAKTFMQLESIDQAALKAAFDDCVKVTSLTAEYDPFTAFSEVEAALEVDDNVDDEYDEE